MDTVNVLIGAVLYANLIAKHSEGTRDIRHSFCYRHQIKSYTNSTKTQQYYDHHEKQQQRL